MTTTISHTDRLTALIEAELATTEMTADEFDVQGCVEQLRAIEQDMDLELDPIKDGLLIAGTLEDYWLGE